MLHRQSDKADRSAQSAILSRLPHDKTINRRDDLRSRSQFVAPSTMLILFGRVIKNRPLANSRYWMYATERKQRKDEEGGGKKKARNVKSRYHATRRRDVHAADAPPFSTCIIRSSPKSTKIESKLALKREEHQTESESS